MTRGLAVVVLIAVWAAACSSDLETPAETLSGNGQTDSLFGYVVEEPPAGYELCAVSVPSALSVQADTSASLHVYTDASLSDPYQGPLYGVAMFPAGPIEEIDLGDTREVRVGETSGFIGAMDGLQIAALPPGEGRVVTFEADEDRVIQVAVRNDPEVDLVALASAVTVDADSATLPASALPEGFVDLGDLYELEGRPRFLFSVDYQRQRADDGGLDDQLTLLGASGQIDSMEAFRFRALTSEQVEVQGRPGVVADIGSDGAGPFVVSWLAEDDLILRLFSFGIAPDTLISLAGRVSRVDGEDWESLQASFDPATCQF